MKEVVGWITVVTVIAFVGSPFALAADEIEDQIKKGLKEYMDGLYSTSVQTLQYAAGQIQQLMAENLKKIFPEPLDDWTASEAKGEFTPLAMMGGAVSASKKYKDKTGQQVEIEIITNAAVLQGVLMMMSNPMFLASDPNSKLTNINGNTAVKKFSIESGNGELSIPVQNQMLVQINGKKLKSDKPLTDYGERMDYEALKKFLSK